VLQCKLRSLPNVTIITNAQTTEITGDGSKVNGLRYKDRASGEKHLVDLEGVFVQIGLVPNTDWLKGTVELSPHGEIVVDAKGQTSVPGVFAAGDCTTVPFKQIIIAAGDGAKAALGAFRPPDPQRSPKRAVPTRTSVLPACTAASRSADMPMDRVSSAKPCALSWSNKARVRRWTASMRVKSSDGSGMVINPRRRMPLRLLIACAS
jgi:pyruvate/2-oxoglutarate dehydrogenase complex dihydrolipoamide dehydrogenase (E3) component